MNSQKCKCCKKLKKRIAKQSKATEMKLIVLAIIFLGISMLFFSQTMQIKELQLEISSALEANKSLSTKSHNTDNGLMQAMISMERRLQKMEKERKNSKNSKI